MGHTLRSLKKHKHIHISDIPGYIAERFDLVVDITNVHAVIREKLLPTYAMGGEAVAFLSDVEDLRHVFVKNESSYFQYTGDLFLLGDHGVIPLGDDAAVDYPSVNNDVDYTYFSAFRNLASFCCNKSQTKNHNENNYIPYFSHTRVLAKSGSVERFVQSQRELANKVNKTSAGHFANSAAYMGSKRVLSGFIVEGISTVLGEDGVVIDLMCGSGAASGAFSRVWRTYASDAQEFSRVLAAIQGGGFTINKAQKLLERIHSEAVAHSELLMTTIKESLDWEEKIFHSDYGDALLTEYAKFMSSFPTYPDGGKLHGWDPCGAVKLRKEDVSLKPYCLFTAYFSNIYFGLRQCVEIDSLRYAIDTLDDEESRVWALGSLITAASRLGTTYGGHFAQPLPYIRDKNKLTLKNLSKILEKRALSITHEFSIRLLDLAGESENASYPVETVAGPWQQALSDLDDELVGCSVVVYLDAPYTREEYSRYYHLLETLVKYHYPSCVGEGKTPNKKEGERFKSEFFTRNVKALDNIFEKLIVDILNRNWICAWSYSDTGRAQIVDVVESVTQRTNCTIKTFSTPYRHKPQGGSKSKQITEYLILFIPDMAKK